MFDDIRDLTFVAGAALILLAGLVVGVQPRSPLHRAFALLLLLRGAMYALLGWDDSVHSTAGKLTGAVALAIPLAAVNFAMVLAAGGSPLTRAIVRVGLVAAWLLTQLAYLADPDLFLGTEGGMALNDLFIDSGDTAYAALALFLALRAERTPGRVHRGGLLLMSAGFALQPALQATFRLGRLVDNYPVYAAVFVQNLLALSTVALLIGVVAQVGQMAVRGAERSMRAPARRYLMVLTAPVLCALAVLMVWQLTPGQFGVEAPIRLALDILFVSSAFWNLTLFAVAAFALTRYQLFGVERHARQALQTVVAAAGVLGVYSLTEALAGAWSPLGPIESSAAGAGAVAVLAVPIVWAAGRIAGRALPGVEDTPAYLEARRIQMFWHEAEAILSDRLLTEQEREALERARVQWGLDEAEAESVVAQVLEQMPPVRSAYFPMLGQRDSVARQ